MLTAKDLIEKKGSDLFSVESETTIYDALKIMVDKKIGSILVTEKKKIIGIWTERDLMRNSLKPEFNPKTALVKDCMTPEVHAAPASHNIYQLMAMFLELRHRHLVIEKDGDFIGLIAIEDILKAKLQEKDWELKELNKIASWEYYENWPR